MTSSLELPARPTATASPQRARFGRIALIAAAVILPLSWFIWFINTPGEFTTTADHASGSTLAGNAAYVGMYTTPSGFDREIRISGVKVEATASTEVSVKPLICRGGSIGVTTQPDQFCRGLDEVEGATFAEGDSIVLQVTSPDPAVVEIDRVRIGFHQDIRSATQPAGIAGATLTFTARPQG